MSFRGAESGKSFAPALVASEFSDFHFEAYGPLFSSLSRNSAPSPRQFSTSRARSQPVARKRGRHRCLSIARARSMKLKLNGARAIEKFRRLRKYKQLGPPSRGICNVGHVDLAPGYPGVSSFRRDGRRAVHGPGTRITYIVSGPPKYRPVRRTASIPIRPCLRDCAREPGSAPRRCSALSACRLFPEPAASRKASLRNRESNRQIVFESLSLERTEQFALDY